MGSTTHKITGEGTPDTKDVRQLSSLVIPFLPIGVNTKLEAETVNERRKGWNT